MRYRLLAIVLFGGILVFSISSEGNPIQNALSFYLPDLDSATFTTTEKERFLLYSFKENNLFNTFTAYGSYDFFNDLSKDINIDLYDKIDLRDSYPFTEIDPLFVEWFRRQFSIPDPDKRLNLLSVVSYGEIYNRKYGILKDMRYLALSYIYIKQKKVEYRKIASEYIANFYGNGWFDLLSKVNSVERESIISDNSDYSFELTYYGHERSFWVRRMIDGSANACWFLIYDIMKKYDSQWLESLEQAAPYGFDQVQYTTGVLKDNLKVRTAPDLKSKTLTVLPKETSVKVIARSLDSMVIDGLSGYWYLVETESFRGWSFGPFIEIYSKSAEEITTLWYNISDFCDYETKRQQYFLDAFFKYEAYKGPAYIEGNYKNILSNKREYIADMGDGKTLTFYHTDLSNEYLEFSYTSAGRPDSPFIRNINEFYLGSGEDALVKLKEQLGEPEYDESSRSYNFPVERGALIRSLIDDYPVLNFIDAIGLEITGENQYSIYYRFYVAMD